MSRAILLNQSGNDTGFVYRLQISQSQAIEEEERHHTALMDSYNAAFVGRRPQLIKTMELIRKEKNAVFVITGQQGCGKSAFMVSAYNVFGRLKASL